MENELSLSCGKTPGAESGSRLRREFVRFVLVGLAATVTTGSVLILGVEVWAADPVMASVAGYAAGVVVNYVLNYRFTFRSETEHRIVIPKFLVVMGIGMAINTLVMSVGTAALGLHYLLAQVCAIGIVLIWNFTANRSWAFAGRF